MSGKRTIPGAHGRQVSRPAFMLVAVLVALVVSVTLFGLWARSAFEAERRLDAVAKRWQAIRLAEAGIGRALARLRATAAEPADARYDGEVWTIPATALDQPHGAEVRIRVTTSPDATKRLVEAIAQYPTGRIRHAQITRRIEIPNPNPGTQP